MNGSAVVRWVEKIGWRSYLSQMRLVLMVFIVGVEALIRFLFPRANSHSRLAFEEPKRPGRRGDGSGSGVPVVPDRPLGMSGGAAAAMEFDD